MADRILTRRLILRRFRPSDAAALHAIMSDAEVMQFWSTPPHKEIVETERWVERTILACDAGDSDDFAVLHEGLLIGKAGLWKGNELGMLFARSAWGKGLAREAVEAVLTRASERSVEAITADVDPRNVRAVRFLLRLGFIETGRAQRTYKIGDTWTDSVYFERRMASDV